MAIENVRIINPPIAGIVYFPAKKKKTTKNKPYVVDNDVIV